MKDLERTLETLTRYSEQSWRDQLEYNKDGLLHVGKKFIDFKTKVNSVREALE